MQKQLKSVRLITIIGFLSVLLAACNLGGFFETNLNLFYIDEEVKLTQGSSVELGITISGLQPESLVVQGLPEGVTVSFNESRALRAQTSDPFFWWKATFIATEQAAVGSYALNLEATADGKTDEEPFSLIVVPAESSETP